MDGVQNFSLTGTIDLTLEYAYTLVNDVYEHAVYDGRPVSDAALILARDIVFNLAEQPAQARMQAIQNTEGSSVDSLAEQIWEGIEDGVMDDMKEARDRAEMYGVRLYLKIEREGVFLELGREGVEGRSQLGIVRRDVAENENSGIDSVFESLNLGDGKV